jgi:hypothetical protein
MTLAEIDAQALAFAQRVSDRQPLALTGVMNWLSGGNEAQKAANSQTDNAIGAEHGYYQGADKDTQNNYNDLDKDISQYYTGAENQVNNEVNGNVGSSVLAEQGAALRKQFADQQKQLTGSLAAQGILGGAGGNIDMADLGGSQAAAIAQADAPLYQQAMNAYDNLVSGDANARSGARGQEMQNLYNSGQNAAATYSGQKSMGVQQGATAAQNANNQFMNAIELAAGVPPTNSTASPGSADYASQHASDPDNVFNVPTSQGPLAPPNPYSNIGSIPTTISPLGPGPVNVNTPWGNSEATTQNNSAGQATYNPYDTAA